MATNVASPRKRYDAEGKRVKETYRLDYRRLLDVLSTLNAYDATHHFSGRDAPFVLTPEGIGIWGNYVRSTGAQLKCFVGRLVPQREKGKLVLCLETFDYHPRHLITGSARPNPVEVLERFII